MEKRDALINLVKGKDVFMGTHWDADGVTSGALIYHMIKKHAKSIQTLSKGDVFVIAKEDVPGNPDIIICTDIHPSTELDPKKIIYIDHHPSEDNDKFLMHIHDDKEQSCSLLIWKELLQDTEDPYFIFLTLLGYFGDNGKKEDLPLELFMKAQKLLTTNTKFGEHNLMAKKESRWSDGYYYEVQRFVSALNTGKRMNWSGDIPFECLKQITNFRDFIYNKHPYAKQLQLYRQELRDYYSMKIDVKELENIHYSIISCDKNVQGVLCARYMKDKPIIVINKLGDKVIASMRVPDDLDFDAGAYLSEFTTKMKTVVGGGHEKAGGVTFEAHEMDKFIELIENSSFM